jgi:hypothetical protein
MSVLNEKQDIQNEEDLYFNFINSIKSEVTKKNLRERRKILFEILQPN